jgi:hypothetical protein
VCFDRTAKTIYYKNLFFFYSVCILNPDNHIVNCLKKKLFKNSILPIFKSFKLFKPGTLNPEHKTILPVHHLFVTLLTLFLSCPLDIPPISHLYPISYNEVGYLWVKGRIWIDYRKEKKEEMIKTCQRPPGSFSKRVSPSSILFGNHGGADLFA